MKKSLIIISSIVLLFLAADYASAQKNKNTKPKNKTNSGSKGVQDNSQQNFFGEIEGDSYKNKYFGIKITIPENWLAQESEVGKAMKKLGAAVVKGKTAQTQKAFDEAVQRVTPLFTASKDILGLENNAIMGFAAEKKHPLAQIRDGQDYLRLNIQTFKKLTLPPDFKYSETIKSETFGGETFYYIDVERTNFQQRFYAIYRKGYSLFFTLTFATDEDLETMKEVLRNSDFAWKE